MWVVCVCAVHFRHNTKGGGGGGGLLSRRGGGTLHERDLLNSARFTIDY